MFRLYLAVVCAYLSVYGIVMAYVCAFTSKCIHTTSIIAAANPIEGVILLQCARTFPDK